ncbi:hypothetical protein AN216_20125 [Streptomyces oceani]|uniref:Uncharacterized protein n=1 Tax=Streptomyces oceani TaxID=1075402 RepID=A0A1E7JY84_9ACTN|nr:hypothetical protein AN216_20125 [Streptomyces oceani]
MNIDGHHTPVQGTFPHFLIAVQVGQPAESLRDGHHISLDSKSALPEERRLPFRRTPTHVTFADKVDSPFPGHVDQITHPEVSVVAGQFSSLLVICFQELRVMWMMTEKGVEIGNDAPFGMEIRKGRL